MKKRRINAHPARRIYRKIARIESGVRQKTFGSCDLIKQGETGDAKCLAPSTLAPPDAGLFLSRPLARHRAVAATMFAGLPTPDLGRVLINAQMSDFWGEAEILCSTRALSGSDPTATPTRIPHGR
jgi:hypothetical protein